MLSLFAIINNNDLVLLYFCQTLFLVGNNDSINNNCFVFSCLVLLYNNSNNIVLSCLALSLLLSCSCLFIIIIIIILIINEKIKKFWVPARSDGDSSRLSAAQLIGCLQMKLKSF